ncbi:MAG: redoxin domain-containing protein [Pyrinomonadaceae bacterium]|nr:redoxin domain-containing protein [Pyrinomonadaceae bacterium]
MKLKALVKTGILFLAIGAIFSHAVYAVGNISVGDKFEGFTLSDTNGKEHKYADLKGENGAVVIYLSVQCPIVKAYDDRINQLAADYKAKGINFIGINSNSTETLEDVKAHAAANYKFPVLIDKDNVLADRMGATVTPEIYYFNAKDVLLYEGAIDNDRSGKNISTNYARDAFDSGLTGKTIETTSSKAFGCSIKRKKEVE